MAGKRTPAAETPPAEPVEPVEPVESVEVSDPAEPVEDERPGSEQVLVVLPAEDEPVRRGGHILTDAGWVPEDLVPEQEG